MRAAALALTLAACTTTTAPRPDAGDVDAIAHVDDAAAAADDGAELGADAALDGGAMDGTDAIARDLGDVDEGIDAGDVDAGVDAGDVVAPDVACARATAASPLPFCTTDRCVATGPIPEADVEACEAARRDVTTCSTVALYPLACYFVEAG